ncbi:AraC family transcriptional regulator [Brevibacterium oceani]|uniref:AraC family transcriptional regulator n=1 Tax=Brevibacterium oceani TaxID=358099 RepID=UPI0015E64BD9|nr:AraC family transcriptional regulator [Brevibacterium oceani]
MFDESSWSSDRLVEDTDYRFVSRHYATGTPYGLRLVRYSVYREGSFGVHVEPDIHQLTWFDGAMLGVFADQEFSVVPPTHAMWIPAGTVHDIAALGLGTMYCAYLRVRPFRSDFDTPCRVEMTGLMRELLDHLSGDISVDAGLRARAVLLDALESMAGTAPSLTYPTHPVARAIAEGIVDDPSRRVSMAEEASRHGVSARTIRRIFLTETGSNYQQWSTAARLNASLELVKGGSALDEVARAVGFSSASSYVSAFRNHFGMTPGRLRDGRASAEF